jgi:zinc transporter 1
VVVVELLVVVVVVVVVVVELVVVVAKWWWQVGAQPWLPMGGKDKRKGEYAALSSDAEDEEAGSAPPRAGMSSQTRLLIALALNLSYTCAELAAYYSFDSLAMLTDAVHNLSDVVAIVIAYFIEGLKTDTDRGRFTFGVRRAEVLGGVLNGTVLLALCFYIVCDAVPRFIEPPIMEITPSFIAVAAAGVPINIASALLFIGSATQPQHAHAHGPDGKCPSEEQPAGAGNMNLWAVFLHSLGDALTSVGVTIVAVIIYMNGRDVEILAGGCADGVVVVGSLGAAELRALAASGNGTAAFRTMEISCSWTDYLDCGVSVLLSVIISLSVIPLLRQGVPVLLDRSPLSASELDEVRTRLEDVETVLSVDALHVWKPDRTQLVCMVHATIEHGGKRDAAAAGIREAMLKHAGVRHVSVQISEQQRVLGRSLSHGSSPPSSPSRWSSPGGFAMMAAASCECDDCEQPPGAPPPPAGAGAGARAAKWPWSTENASIYSRGAG